ncbi:class I SAM-dependent methyltransferase [Ahrensia kielensis]|uniref:Class I SAM-dependent methyltransferase n=1 Tax=Ahrensia kielensis TaxID=76980 RepID=A0ABU9T4M3_9HYPH
MSNADHSHASLMDTIYGKQRYFYDATRKFYLLGRDQILQRLAVPQSGTMLEIACGTGRNLCLGAKLYPTAKLYGLDISEEMLKSAKANLQRTGLHDKVQLAKGDATNFDGATLFDVSKFDRILLSYAVSMIPDWEVTIEHAAHQLKPGGELWIVDFGNQTKLPNWFKNALYGWLRKFHVQPRQELETVARRVARTVHGTAEFGTLYRGYAQFTVIKKPSIS